MGVASGEGKEVKISGPSWQHPCGEPRRISDPNPGNDKCCHHRVSWEVRTCSLGRPTWHVPGEIVASEVDSNALWGIVSRAQAAELAGNEVDDVA